jgi:hypothetical protein
MKAPEQRNSQSSKAEYLLTPSEITTIYFNLFIHITCYISRFKVYVYLVDCILKVVKKSKRIVTYDDRRKAIVRVMILFGWIPLPHW